MPPATTSILFVCLGNICRSPLAEGVFAHLAEARGAAHRFRVDSAGTGAYHVGQPPDRRMLAVARAHGVRLDSLARQVTPEDLDEFDLIVAMDRENRRSLHSRPVAAEVVLMRDYDPDAESPDVPDPYYGDAEGFGEVYRIVKRSCEGMLDALGAEGPSHP